MKMIMSPVQEAAAWGLAERAGSRGMAVLPTGKVKDHEKMGVIEASSQFYLGTVSSSAEVASLSKRDGGYLFIYLARYFFWNGTKCPAGPDEGKRSC